VHHSRSGKDQRKGLTETDYARLLDAAHQQHGVPLVVVWDNLNAHVSHAMADLIALTSAKLVRTPRCAGDLADGVGRSHPARTALNLAQPT
jgi:hypothetical protein